MISSCARILRSSFAVALVAFGSYSTFVAGQAQQQGPAKTMGSQGPVDPASRKALIERRFLSKHPMPQRHLGGVLPGANVLDRLADRQDALKQRLQAAHVSQAVSTATSAGPYPGIALRPMLPTNQLPTSVAAGDFNKDGHMDFVIANGDTNDLWLYLGNGDGTFQLPRIIPLSKGLSPVYVAAADLRKNGTLDLVVAEFDTSTIGVLLGNGDGTFGFEQAYALPQPPAALVVDDFNHDGHLDVAAVMDTLDSFSSTYPPYLALLSGDGTGNFAAPVITYNAGYYSSAVNLSSGDVNGDGLPDVLITGPGNENSEVFLNNGDGTFKAAQTILENGLATIILDGRLADVNGDGCKDAVIADAVGGAWVSLGDCSGNFRTPRAFPLGDSPAAVQVVDINGDGIPDLVTTSTPLLGGFNISSTGNTLDVAFGDGKGSFGTSRTYQGPGESLSFAVADFNGDGKPEVVTVNNDTASATLYVNDGEGAFGFPQGLYSGASNKGLPLSPEIGASFADLNGDGKTDVFFVGFSSNPDFYALSFLNDGTGKFSPALASDSGIQSQSIGDYKLGDFRHTGHMDLVAIGLDAQYSGSSQYILFMPGNGDGTFGSGTLVTANGADGLMATADFNGDGKLDLIAVNGGFNHTLTPFLGNGDGTFRAGSPVSFSDSNGEIGRVFTGDFNHDGKMDVLVLTTYNVVPANPVVWEFLGKGDGTFQPPKQLLTEFEDFALADMNGDGCPDIAQYDEYLTTNPYSPPSSELVTLTNFLCQADGTFTQSSTYSPYPGGPAPLVEYNQFGDTNDSALLGDFNGDGKQDELGWQAAPGYARYIQMLMGNGDGTFTPTYDVFPRYILNDPYYSHDLDGDGVSDLLELDILSNALNVVKGAHAPALQLELEEAVATGNQGCGWVFPDVASNSDRTAALFSSVSGVLLPSTVTIPANATSARFCYTLTSNFDWRQVFDINAQLSGDTATVYASDSYIFGFDEEISPTTVPVVYSGDTSEPITITLTAAAGYGSSVKLSCQGMPTGDNCQFGTTTLAISSGGTASTTVKLVTGADPGKYGDYPQFTIVADDGNVTRQQTIGIYVATLSILDLANGGQPLHGESPSTIAVNLTVFGIPPYTFSCSGLPAGATCSFAGTQVPYPNETTIVDTISIPAGIVDGNYPIEVTVNSGSYSSSVSETLSVVGINVQGPATSSSWAIVGTPQTIPITVQPSPGAPPGTILITCSLDVSATCSGGSVDASQGTQTMNLTLTPSQGTTPGVHQMTVTVAYSGSSQNFTFPITVVDYSGSLTPPSVTLSRGGSTTVTATLNATAGFSNAVSLACSGTTQVTCTFSPTSTQLAGGTSQTVTITLTAGNFAMARPEENRSELKGLLKLALVLPLFMVAGFGRKRRIHLVTVIAAISVLASIASCGGGGGGSGTGGGGSGGGGTSSYTVTVSASATGTSAVRTVGTVAVTVNH